MAASLAFTAACKKNQPPVSAPAPEKIAQLPMPAARPDGSAATSAKDAEMQRALEKRYPGKPVEQEAARSAMTALDAQIDAEAKLAEINQRTMVLPAPPDFRPERTARKVQLRLTLEKPRIRVGENPRFRLELMNVGQEPITYQEYQSSIFKGGSIGYSMRTIHFHLTDRRGKRLDLFPALGRGRAAPVQYHDATPTSEKEMLESNAMSAASTSFKVKLRPGETLRSLGDGDSVQEPFRTLRVEEGFENPGTYKLRVELDDRPTPLNDIYIKFARRFNSLDEINKTHERRMKDALGPVYSNEAPLEITR